MRPFILKIAVSIVMLFSGAMSAFPLETAREQAANIDFPDTESFKHQGAEHILTLTGVTSRRVLIFKIYTIAHYMEGGEKNSPRDAIDAVMTDGKAKEIVIEYVRDLGGDKVQETLREGFLKNTTPVEYGEIRPFVDRLCRYFDDKMIRKNDRAVFRWMAEGTVIAIYNGREIATVCNTTFARALWSIWFGDRSVVDRGSLIKRIVPGVSKPAGRDSYNA